MRKIPATIVTGFLGAGKTSLIRHLMSNAQGRRIALVINEFGELGIDRDILLGCGIEDCREGDVIELANGCICCTVAEDFLPAISRLLDRPDPPEHIVIETSGLALPKPLVQAFAWPEVRARVTVDGVVAIIDAAAVADGRFADDPASLAAQRAADPSVAHDNPLEEVFGDQLGCADLVVLNKIDLVEGAALAAAETAVRERLRPAVKLVHSRGGAVPVAALLGLAAAAEDDLANRPSHHDLEEGHDHEDFESFVVSRGPIADPVGFLERAAGVIAGHDILRLKGFVDVPAKEFRHVVQGVGSRLQHYFDRPWRSDERRFTRLVVIGRKGLDRAAIAA
ncbi:MAG TPA: cobalamin biosynthesis protein CobW, partial [Stellaceae bacterium]|nr:cobalamin biosynthesis protein CobW [Stellaceae bacterium]